MLELIVLGFPVLRLGAHMVHTPFEKRLLQHNQQKCICLDYAFDWWV